MRTLVKRKIEQAFPLEPSPDPSVAIEDTHSVEHLHEILGRRRWSDLTPLDYRRCSDGFSLLTVAGLHYYLPGYLLSELADPEEADVIAEHCLSTLGKMSSFDVGRTTALGKLVTFDQIDAIALWVAYYANTYEADKYVRRSYETLETWVDDKLEMDAGND